jgi:hypothetical protein
MTIHTHFFRGYSALVLAGLLTVSASALAQNSALPDAQVEANVLRALAGAPQLATQSIKTTTVYGTVTLSGNVTDEASRTLAETLASKASGVQKVVDELTLGDSATTPAADQASQAPADQGSAPQLQSDGTMAPAPNQSQPGAAPQDQPQDPQQGQMAPPPPPQSPGAPPVYRQPYYRNAPPAGYAQQQAPPPGAQEAGKPVTIPVGALVRMRINEGLNAKRVQAGAIVDGTVLNDVVADGEVAIPRGASVQATLVESKNSGAVGGRGELALQLTNVTLGGKTFPIVSDTWTHEGQSKTGQTVGHAVGLGAFGALIGAVAGGGPGAAIGAVAGGAAGVGLSAASGRGQTVIPAEAILTFHLTQPAPVTTVSQAEMDRLAYGVQQSQLQRRPPPPPPGYYGRPVYYPYPY